MKVTETAMRNDDGPYRPTTATEHLETTDTVAYTEDLDGGEFK